MGCARVIAPEWLSTGKSTVTLVPYNYCVGSTNLGGNGVSGKWVMSRESELVFAGEDGGCILPSLML